MAIDTLNPELPTTSADIPVAEPCPAMPPGSKAPCSAKPLSNFSRCHFRYPNGRRCTLPGLSAKFGLCLRHYHRQVAAGLPLAPSPNDSADLSDDLLVGFSQFSSAEDLREFLTRLLILMTKGRVSPRRAAVLAYITNQLLHSHRVVLKEAESQPIIFDLPRPKLDEVPAPGAGAKTP